MLCLNISYQTPFDSGSTMKNKFWVGGTKMGLLFIATFSNHKTFQSFRIHGECNSSKNCRCFHDDSASSIKKYSYKFSELYYLTLCRWMQFCHIYGGNEVGDQVIYRIIYIICTEHLNEVIIRCTQWQALPLNVY